MPSRGLGFPEATADITERIHLRAMGRNAVAAQNRTDITGVSRSVNTTCRVLISKPVGLSGFCQSKTITWYHGIMPSMHYSAVHPHPYTKVSVICGPGRKKLNEPFLLASG